MSRNVCNHDNVYSMGNVTMSDRAWFGLRNDMQERIRNEKREKERFKTICPECGKEGNHWAAIMFENRPIDGDEGHPKGYWVCYAKGLSDIGGSDVRFL